MCGIAGYINFDIQKSASSEIIKKMTDIIAHRGPDGEGFYVKDNLALGHRRLSIIDLSTGSQPMYNKDKSLVIVFNGEIYNYIELREELKTLGYSFVTTSDTEVIINAYEEWGTNCQLKLNGCWAFAIWDSRKNILFISRDRFGEKPLHYSVWDNTFVFGSEIKSLFAYGVPDEKDFSLVELYFFLKFIPAPYSFFKQVKKLKPGHYLIVRDGGIKEYKYWDLPEIDEHNMITDKNSVYDNFESLLKDSVKIRMRSDVPYGALLSGGLDSAAVVSLMSEISSHPVETFTIGYDYADFDERELAQAVAERYKTNHHVYEVLPESFDESLKKILFHYDEPFGDASAIPTGIVSAFARKHVKMVLSGDGGDEVLSGYPGYQGVKFSERFKKYPSFIRSGAKGSLSLASKPAKGTLRYKLNRYRRLLRTAELDFNDSMIERLPTNDASVLKSLVCDKKNLYSIKDFLNDFMNSCTYKDDFYRMMYFDFKLIFPEDMLVKVDRMSMAHSLEARIPFNDHRLVEYMAHVHKDIKMEGYTRKSILRNTVGKKLPPSLLSASKKGFRVPIVEWFKSSEFLSKFKKLYTDNSMLNAVVIKSLIDENTSGKKDNSNIIWMIVILEESIKN
ncbi:MAG: asparagine synthase (glutamine-hydrolyzing) [Ignavibacteria bacterium]|nr:asparagine synthase (glutamine-hydrolyzing) [Ignavibacteria bacterium]